MSCFRPLAAYRSSGGEVWIGENPTKDGYKLELPCGRCVGCKLDARRAWSIRIMHEAQLYDRNWFATLTYADEHLPSSRSLEYRHFQLFMKRLRKRLRGVSEGPEGGRPLRFFCAGEYGGRTSRPHFHAILFNLSTGDEQEYVNGSFRSAMLEELWLKGTVQLDSVTPQSAAYVAGYSQKKVHGPRAALYYEDVIDVKTGEVTRRRPEFVAMSLKPGIGTWWFRKYGKDLFPHDFAVSEGKRWKVPRFYWNKFRLEADGAQVEELEYGRFLRAQASAGESTPERRAVREEVALRRQEMFQERGL